MLTPLLPFIGHRENEKNQAKVVIAKMPSGEPPVAAAASMFKNRHMREMIINNIHIQ